MGKINAKCFAPVTHKAQPSQFVRVFSSLCVVTPKLHQEGMTRLRKRTQHCRRISRLRFDRKDTESGSDSDGVIEIEDDGFRDETVVRPVEQAIKWVDDAYCRMYQVVFSP